MDKVDSFITKYYKPEANHAEYERPAEESALKRKMLAQETDRKYYQSKAVLNDRGAAVADKIREMKLF